MNFILFDEETAWKNLLPFTYTRPISEIRIGVLTIREKWEVWLNTKCGFLTQEYLSKKFAGKKQEDSVFINSSVCPNSNLVDAIKNIKPNQKISCGDVVIAYHNNGSENITITGSFMQIKNTWDIFQKNGEAIKSDFEILTKNKTTQALSSTVTVIGDKSLVFLEKGARAEACILNTTSGPIYIGTDSEIMEGSVVRGPFALCEHSALKLSTKIYGPTTVGPHSKVGGEVNNSVIFGFSNKAHDGFLGNSVIGEWCNLGADTNNSNLKNNYGNVKLFNYLHNKSVDTGLQFCGLMMGDHSKSGINTMFNTGTVVGVGSNIYGGGFPATHIPSFSWGGAEGLETYRLEKLFETAEKVYERRGVKFDSTEQEILKHVFNLTSGYRND